MTESFWRRCSSCKKEIAFGAPHWICSVSSCNRKGSSYVFCSVGCWDAHVPIMRHREAWAEEPGGMRLMFDALRVAAMGSIDNPTEPPTEEPPNDSSGGCSVSASGAGGMWPWLFLLFVFRRRSR